MGNFGEFSKCEFWKKTDESFNKSRFPSVVTSKTRWDKIFKNGPSKIFKRLYSTNFTWFILEYFVPNDANPFEPSVVFHIETSHLICAANAMTGLYMKCNTGLKQVKVGLYIMLTTQSNLSTHLVLRCWTKPWNNTTNTLSKVNCKTYLMQ